MRITKIIISFTITAATILNIFILSEGVGINAESDNITESLYWTKDIKKSEWSFEVSKPGKHIFSIRYKTLPGDASIIKRRLRISGSDTVSDWKEIYLSRSWQEITDGEIKQNSAGDDIRPRMQEIHFMTESVLYDWFGPGNSPYVVDLKPGIYTLEMEYVHGDIEMYSLDVLEFEGIPDYLSYISSLENDFGNIIQEPVYFEAETTFICSDPAVRREYEEDISVSPDGKGYRRLNTIGGERWRNAGQWVEYKFTVPKNGLYKIALHIKQEWNDGLPSHRKIEIDGRVLFDELGAYRFHFLDGYRMEVLGNDGEPFYVYLGKGEHTLRFTVVLGDTKQILDGVNKSINDISFLYQDIVKLTSSTPDLNYDYEFERYIPELDSRLTDITKEMRDLSSELEIIAGRRTAVSNYMGNTGELFAQMAEDPFSIARKLEDINQTLISLATWINVLEQQPIAIDSIQIADPNSTIMVPDVKIWERLVAFWRTFILSFIKDYDHVGSTGSAESTGSRIDVWVARGNEWAELLKELADAKFTPDTGIGLKVNVLTADQLKTGGVNALMLAVAAGNAPDVCTGMDIDAPVEFAIRDAVESLSELNGFQTIKDRFYPSLLTPVYYQGKYYAIPETMNFIVLFYRTDILSDLGLTPPESWDDVYEKILPVLYRNNKLFNYPSSTELTKSNFNSFGTFLFQHGGDLYTSDGSKSALNTPEAFRAFDEWTKLYTNYDFPIAANFFNRFRSGEMPIGVGGYDAYVLFSTAAPELKGKWDIAPIPGQIAPDGTLNTTATGISGTYGVILSQCRDVPSAWKFLDWWTSDETQIEYGQEIEALMGLEARWNTSNKYAFERLPWEEGHLDTLNACFRSAKEKPVVLGGYFSLRHITNAWTRVVINGMEARESLEMAYKDINDELLKKRREYGLEGKLE